MPWSYTYLSDSGHDDVNWALISADYKEIAGFCGGAYVCNFRVKLHKDRPRNSRDGMPPHFFTNVNIKDSEKETLLNSLAVSIIEECADRERSVLFFYNGDSEAQYKGDEYAEHTGCKISFDDLIKNLGGKVISEVINPNTGFNINVWMADVTNDPRLEEARDRMIMEDEEPPVLDMDEFL